MSEKDSPAEKPPRKRSRKTAADKSTESAKAEQAAKPARKKRTPAAKSKAKSESNPAKAKRTWPQIKSRMFGTLWSIIWKGGLTLTLVIALYVIYLDSKISRQFEGNKWQLPAQVYARAMQFYPGQYLSIDEVIWELKRLNYSQVNQLSSTGQYIVQGNKITIHMRSFEFFDGPEADRVIELGFGGQKLRTIRDLALGNLTTARLEPVQIARLSNATGQDREFVPLERIPEMLKDALLVVEDRDFYHHHGVSPFSILRALYSNIRAGRTVQGGSTLTQQLAKNFYLSRERSFNRKFNEALIALILDFRYSKDQILEAYLNEVYLGQAYNQGVHGVELASEFYFAKPVDELEYHQIALLVGLVKGPSYFNPRRYPERAMERRDLVLRLMAEDQLISPREYQIALNRPLGIEDMEKSAKVSHPGYLDLVSRELNELLDSQDILDAGVRVFTYFDLHKQTAMEDAVAAGLPLLERNKKVSQLQAAMVSVNVEYNGISALVAGRDTRLSGFNRVLDSQRNIGSLVKPAVYLTALSTPQYHLGTLLADKPLSLKDEQGNRWQPDNYDHQYRGEVPLYQAFSQSINLPAVNLGLAVGVDKVAGTLTKLGIESAINPYPSLLLGALELSSLDVAQMYSTIANSGRYQKLTSIAAITDAVGGVIYQHHNAKETRFDQDAMYLTKYAMKRVTLEGTAKKLKQAFPTIQFAGKTGTTNELRDSWFAGFDQNTVTVTWLGRDDNKVAGLTGGQGALEVYIRYLKELNPESIADQRPASIKWAFVSEQTGRQAPPGCGKVVNLPVRAAEFLATPACM
ncbi:penicillin-binding protein 1B [Pseudoalteromonas tunicata]|uniref:penicillin-binding protein 1B n=1 Tax=Pseudoalteromonas tunicata TaxID=314281 RepID=UPI003515CBC3